MVGVEKFAVWLSCRKMPCRDTDAVSGHSLPDLRSPKNLTNGFVNWQSGGGNGSPSVCSTPNRGSELRFRVNAMPADSNADSRRVIVCEAKLSFEEPDAVILHVRICGSPG